MVKLTKLCIELNQWLASGMKIKMGKQSRLHYKIGKILMLINELFYFK